MPARFATLRSIALNLRGLDPRPPNPNQARARSAPSPEPAALFYSMQGAPRGKQFRRQICAPSRLLQLDAQAGAWKSRTTTKASGFRFLEPSAFSPSRMERLKAAELGFRIDSRHEPKVA